MPGARPPRLPPARTSDGSQRNRIPSSSIHDLKRLVAAPMPERPPIDSPRVFAPEGANTHLGGASLACTTTPAAPG